MKIHLFPASALVATALAMTIPSNPSLQISPPTNLTLDSHPILTLPANLTLSSLSSLTSTALYAQGDPWPDAPFRRYLYTLDDWVQLNSVHPKEGGNKLPYRANVNNALVDDVWFRVFKAGNSREPVTNVHIGKPLFQFKLSATKDPITAWWASRVVEVLCGLIQRHGVASTEGVLVEKGKEVAVWSFLA